MNKAFIISVFDDIMQSSRNKINDIVLLQLPTNWAKNIYLKWKNVGTEIKGVRSDEQKKVATLSA